MAGWGALAAVDLGFPPLAVRQSNCSGSSRRSATTVVYRRAWYPTDFVAWLSPDAPDTVFAKHRVSGHDCAPLLDGLGSEQAVEWGKLTRRLGIRPQ